MTAPERAAGPDVDEFAHVSPFQVHVSPNTAPDAEYPPNSTSVVGPEPETKDKAASERADGVAAGSCELQSGPWNWVIGDGPDPSGEVTPPTVVVPTDDTPGPPIEGRVTVIGVVPRIMSADVSRSDADSSGPDAFTGPVTTPGGGGRFAGSVPVAARPLGPTSGAAETGTIPPSNPTRHAPAAATAIHRRVEPDTTWRIDPPPLLASTGVRP
jgi:hypothetical protein